MLVLPERGFVLEFFGHHDVFFLPQIYEQKANRIEVAGQKNILEEQTLLMHLNDSCKQAGDITVAITWIMIRLSRSPEV